MDIFFIFINLIYFAIINIISFIDRKNYLDKNDIKGFGIIIKEIPCCNRYKGYIKEENGYYINRWKFWKIIKIRNL